MYSDTTSSEQEVVKALQVLDSKSLLMENITLITRGDCNDVEPTQSGDAVNLKNLQRIVGMEMKSLHEVIAKI